MARTIKEIQNEIIASKDAETELNGLNSPSGVAIWRLWTRILATAINIHEQFIDLAILEMEQIARESIAGTADWLQQRILEFQYSATEPQVISINDQGIATYPILDESLRIVSRASVSETPNGRVLVKVAKGDTTLEPLGTDEINALIGYLDRLSFVGTPIDTISLEPDRLRVEGTILFSGEFVGSLVKINVITAINDYLASISIDNFDGKVIREKLIDAIQLVPGVVGIDTVNVRLNGRQAQDPLGGGSNVSIVRDYETFAGYIIEEDTVGNTFDDLITMQLSV